jgi:splicing factor 3A subunit 1
VCRFSKGVSVWQTHVSFSLTAVAQVDSVSNPADCFKRLHGVRACGVWRVLWLILWLPRGFNMIRARLAITISCASSSAQSLILAITTPRRYLTMANQSSDAAASTSVELTVKPPPSLVIPPPAVREHVAKTADFVFRRGDVAHFGLKNRVKADPKSNLSFVLEEDAYNPYFEWFVQQLKDGKGQSSQSAKPAIDNKPAGPPEPSKFRFSARMPNISAKDLDVLKLTALYTARCGENWLKELRNREAGNPQFEWLRPTHSFFQFFRSLVDQYNILLDEERTSSDARVEELRSNIENRFHVLDRAKQRAEYVKHVTVQKEREEKKAEDEKKEYATIDWNDFTVIATVLFDEVDDNADLPPPALLNDLQSQSLDQKAMVSLSTRRLEEALPDDTAYYNVNQQYAQQPAFPVAPPVQAPYGAYAPPPMDHRTPAERAREEENARRQAENEQRARAQAATRGAPGRIVNDYVPRAAAKKANVAAVLCPNCKQSIPANEIDEHIRSKYRIFQHETLINAYLQSSYWILDGKSSGRRWKPDTRLPSIQPTSQTTLSALPASAKIYTMALRVWLSRPRKRPGGRRQHCRMMVSPIQRRMPLAWHRCSP